MQILIVDDHKLVSDKLEEIIRRSVPAARCGVVRTLGEALRRLEAAPPALIFLDLNLPDAGGLGALREIGQRVSLDRVVVVSGVEQLSHVSSARQLGVHSYISKGAADIEAVVARVMAGVRQFPPGTPTADSIPRLSPMEIEVLACLSQDISRSNLEVARLLKTTEHNVKRRVLEACGRLDVTNRAAAVEKARMLGIVR